MRFVCGILVFFACIAGLSLAEATEAKQTLDYWLTRQTEHDQVLLTAPEIEAYNEQVREKQSTIVYDLSRYPSQVSGTELQQWLQDSQIPAGYVNGRPVTADWQRQVMARLNLEAVKPMNVVAYGLTVERSHVRAVPTATPVFESPTDQEFDQLQSTILNPGEGVVILQRSGDGLWFFVQSTTYRGWLAASSVAVVPDRKIWQDYLATANFVMVTGSKLTLSLEGKNVLAEMGTKLPLVKADSVAGHTVLLPLRNTAGQVRFVESRLAAGADVEVGYLAYTTENILRQAFKFKGQPYGWGGLHDSVDCSSLIMDVYRCFGFQLPRDADQQEAAAGKSYAVGQIDSARPGAALYMPGHTMLYLGKADDRYYIIHSLGSYGAPGKDGSIQRVPVMQVVISDLSLTRKNGRTFFDSLTTVKEMMP